MACSPDGRDWIKMLAVPLSTDAGALESATVNHSGLASRATLIKEIGSSSNEGALITTTSVGNPIMVETVCSCLEISSKLTFGLI